MSGAAALGVEERVGGLQSAHGLFGEPGGADDRSVPGPAVRHAAPDLPGPAGEAAVQTAAGHRHGAGESRRQDVSEAGSEAGQVQGPHGPRLVRSGQIL